MLGSSAGSLNAAALIDDTEETNWAGVNEADSVDTTSPWVAVDLAGTAARKISSVRVSAMLRPAPPGPTDGLPLLADADDDPDSGAGSPPAPLRGRGVYDELLGHHGHLEADLHQPGRRLPRRRTAPGGSRT